MFLNFKYIVSYFAKLCNLNDIETNNFSLFMTKASVIDLSMIDSLRCLMKICCVFKKFFF